MTGELDINEQTRVVRQLDEDFIELGGSSRHWVQYLNERGYRIATALTSDDLADNDRRIKAEAWDEGFDAGEQDVFKHEKSADGYDSPCIPNPYREVQP